LGQYHKRKETFCPVLGEAHANDKYLIIGLFPGSHEVQEGRPFVGPSGIELMQALEATGISRDECHIEHVISCQPPENNLEKFRYQLKKKTKARKKKDPGWVAPLDPHRACQGHIHQLDYSKYKGIICLGKEAMQLFRKQSSIMTMRGACEEVQQGSGVRGTIRPVKVGYTLHPAFVSRSPEWRDVFQSDIAKAFRYFRGDLRWQWPDVQIAVQDPKRWRDTPHGPYGAAHVKFTDISGDLGPLVVEALIQELVDDGEPVVYDLETDSKYPMVANIRCVGFGNRKRAVVFPINDLRNHPICPDWLGPRVGKLLSDPPFKLIGHNAGQYDRAVMEAHGVTPRLDGDTILMHLLADNEQSHSLGFLGSYYTDNIEAWKADHTATEAKDNVELWVYNAKDCVVNARIIPPVIKQVRRRKQGHLLKREHMLQDAGAGMTRLGLALDAGRLEKIRQAVDTKRHTSATVTSRIAAGVNPLSSQQLSRLLFDTWKLHPVGYSEKTGEPSTDDATLLRMLTTYDLTSDQREFITAVRFLRRCSKVKGTYLTPFSNLSGLYEDKRLHPSYNRLPATGRYSSSNPNAQTVPMYLPGIGWVDADEVYHPLALRSCFIPQRGSVFVGADMDQLELRVIAEEAEASRLLRSFEDGSDPHNDTMEMIYGTGIWRMDGAPVDADGNTDRYGKGGGIFKQTRGITKTVRYAWQYAAKAPKIHEQIIGVEDPVSGKFPYGHYTIPDVRSICKGLDKADPEIPRWWERIVAGYRRDGFVADTLWGRRRDFKGDEKINELVNHPIQSKGASIVHEAMIELLYGEQPWFTTEKASGNGRRETIPFDFKKKYGLVNQCHDSLVFEVPEADAERVAELMTDVMTRKVKGGSVVYSAEADIGERWSDV